MKPSIGENTKTPGNYSLSAFFYRTKVWSAIFKWTTKTTWR